MKGLDKEREGVKNFVMAPKDQEKERISRCWSSFSMSHMEDEFPQLKLVTITIQMIIMSGMPLDGYVHSEQCQTLFISKACSAESRLRPQTITVSKYHLLFLHNLNMTNEPIYFFSHSSASEKKKSYFVTKSLPKRFLEIRNWELK